jgi:hypothetical protein
MTRIQRQFKKLVVAYDKLPQTTKGMDAMAASNYMRDLATQYRDFVQTNNVLELSKRDIARMFMIQAEHQPMLPMAFIQRLSSIYRDHYCDDIM